jgi:mutator protein MutT
MIQVAAAIIRKNGKVLICQRGAGGSTAFLWEFPGGKLEEGETLEQCLIRECKEELEIDIKVNDVFGKSEYEYADGKIAFTFFSADFTGGIIKVNVHKDIKWVLPNELKDYQFCPADVEIVESLKK